MSPPQAFITPAHLEKFIAKNEWLIEFGGHAETFQLLNNVMILLGVHTTMMI